MEILIGVLSLIVFLIVRKFIIREPTKLFYYERGGFAKKRISGKRVTGPPELMKQVGYGGSVHFSRGYLDTEGMHNLDRHQHPLGDGIPSHGRYWVDNDVINGVRFCWLEFDSSNEIEKVL